MQELGQAVDLARAEGDVDEREALEDLVLDRLRPAAADADDAARVLRFSRFASPRWAMNRLSADSRIEQVLKRIRSASRALGGLLVAERLEHAAHALGVVLVHLAAERGDVVASPCRMLMRALAARKQRYLTVRVPLRRLLPCALLHELNSESTGWTAGDVPKVCGTMFGEYPCAMNAFGPTIAASS